MDFFSVLFFLLLLMICYRCCRDPHAGRGQQPNSTIKPQTVLPVHAPFTHNNYNTPLNSPPPVATNVVSGTTYTNTMGIQLQVAPPVVVDMSPDVPLPVYTPNPSVQDIQFSSHPRPNFVTTIAEDPEPVEPVTRT